MRRATRISLLLAVAAVTLAAVAAAVVCCGWYDAVAKPVTAGFFQAASVAAPAAGAQPVAGPKGPPRVGGTPAAVSRTAMTPEERLELLVAGVIDLAIEEVGQQVKGQETTDVETRRQCDRRREEASRKRREMYVVFSQEKEG